MNRLKKEIADLISEGFCIKQKDMRSVGRAMAARDRKLPQKGVINFGPIGKSQLNLDHWVEEELDAGHAVLLRHGKALIY